MKKKLKKTNEQSPVRSLPVLSGVSDGTGQTAVYNTRTMGKTALEILGYADSGYSAGDLLDMLIAYHPDVSKAVSDFTNLCTTRLVFSASGADGKPNKLNQKWLNDFLSRLNNGDPGAEAYIEDYSLRTLAERVNRNLLTRGAAAIEIVVDRMLQPARLWNRPPGRVSFEKNADGSGFKATWDNGQDSVAINNGRFFYKQIDGFDDDLYGVSGILPVLSVVWLQLRILIDLAQIIKKVGYPRVEIEIVEEVLTQNAPANIRSDPKKLADWIDRMIESYRRDYLSIQPEDAYIHTDSLKINLLESQRGTQAFDVRSLMEVIDQQISAALKTLPTLMGRSTGKTGTFSDSQIRLYKATVEHYQGASVDLLSQVMTKCLHLSGRRGSVTALYVPIELRSETEVAQWVATEIHNHFLLFLAGVEDFDEMRRSLRRTPGSLPEVDWDDDQARKNIRDLAGLNGPKQVERSGPGTDDRDNGGNNVAGVKGVLRRVGGGE